jgi:hypothetical protein
LAGRLANEASTRQSDTLLRSYFAVARDGDFDQLVELLPADAAFYGDGDGGGKATATRQPLFGRDRVAMLVLDLFERAKQLVCRVVDSGDKSFAGHFEAATTAEIRSQ